ncbi:MAG: metal-dependent hydrolase [Candidatus Auribacterota bacterium]|jgi:L-ascorbate metabolism protein UlaG (beta-lactamase superfamily)|nr:metal-dependent hydrolase [Candidatus Auribacterota bacterium]
MVKITYFGHSATAIESNGIKVLIDPFFSGNPSSSVKNISDISADFIVITHAHADHIGDSIKIAKRCGAVVLSNFEIINRLNSTGIKGEPLYIGGKREFENGWIKFFPAWHGSSFEDGSYGGLAMSVLVHIDGKTIYHTGDTGLTAEFKIIGEMYTIDIAMLPVGGTFTMDANDAAVAAEWLGAKKVIPIHYNTFKKIQVELTDILKPFKNIVPVTILQPGESCSI